MGLQIIGVHDLAATEFYENEEQVVQDALRYLLLARPDLRIQVAIERYRTDEEISLARAAAIAGVSLERMKGVLEQHNVPLRLGPASIEEAQAEYLALEEQQTTAKQVTATIPSTSVLVEQFDLPAGLDLFNDLTLEERDEFLKGLMIVLSSPPSERQQAVDSHLRHWEIAIDVATRRGRPIPEVIRVYQPKPRRTASELFVEVVHELRSFEKKYGMTSAEFYKKFQTGEIEEGPWDYFEWRGSYSSFLSMKKRYNFSEAEIPYG